MKNLRKFSIAVVLALTFTLPAFAGEISTGIAPPPATPTSDLAKGEVTTGSSEIAASSSLTEAALNLLQSALALF